ncbi:hypothetical protein ABIE67_000253 [Streptomyces sp. V4I8]
MTAHTLTVTTAAGGVLEIAPAYSTVPCIFSLGPD